MARKRKLPRLTKRGSKEIDEKTMDKIMDLIVERKASLREIAFSLNVTYANLCRKLVADPKAKELLEEAREWTVFETGEEIVALADKATNKNIELTKLRINARKDSVGMISRSRESIARSRQSKEENTTTVNVGVVLIPAKVAAPEHTRLPINSPKLVASDGVLIPQRTDG